MQPAWDAVLERAFRRNGIVVAINGDRLRLTYVYGARYEKDGYEPRVHEIFTRPIQEGMIVFDVGAHVGFFTLAAAQRVGRTGKVVAFEPTPATVAVLRRHVSLNQLNDRVEVVPTVVSDAVGETVFYVQGESMSASVSRAAVDELSPQRFDRPASEIVVSTITLDDYCRLQELEPDRVKIDVEGSELRVLRGATRLLRGDAEILCEVHPAQLMAMGDSEDDLLSFIDLHQRKVTHIDDPNELGIYHVLVAPP